MVVGGDPVPRTQAVPTRYIGGSGRSGTLRLELWYNVYMPNADSLEIVVIDTNAFGRGRANLRSLGNVARRLRKRGLDLWVPEVIAWEWAEHIASDVEAFDTASRTTRKLLENAKLIADISGSPYEDRAAIYEAFLENLRNIDSVTILDLSAEAARQGIRDQILQEGAGSKKSGVKTGAADSAFLQGVLDAAGGSFETVVVVTENRKDVERFCKSRDVSLPVMTGLNGLFDVLELVVPAPPLFSRVIRIYLTEGLPWRYRFHPHEDETSSPVEIGVSTRSVPRMEDIPEDAQIEEVEIVVVEKLISLDDVEVEKREEDNPVWPLAVYAWAKLEAIVDVTYIVLDGDGRVDMNVVTTRFEVDTYFTFTMSADMDIVGVDSYDDAEIAKELPW